MISWWNSATESTRGACGFSWILLQFMGLLLENWSYLPSSKVITDYSFYFTLLQDKYYWWGYVIIYIFVCLLYTCLQSAVPNIFGTVKILEVKFFYDSGYLYNYLHSNPTFGYAWEVYSGKILFRIFSLGIQSQNI